MSFGYKYSN